jgi:hypothetical protein
VRRWRVLQEIARQEGTESLAFIEGYKEWWWGRECPRVWPGAECPHVELRTFCQKHGFTDCWGAFMRFIFSEED